MVECYVTAIIWETIVIAMYLQSTSTEEIHRILELNIKINFEKALHLFRQPKMVEGENFKHKKNGNSFLGKTLNFFNWISFKLQNLADFKIF